jgi:hypothetical protein
MLGDEGELDALGSARRFLSGTKVFKRQYMHNTLESAEDWGI